MKYYNFFFYCLRKEKNFIYFVLCMIKRVMGENEVILSKNGFLMLLLIYLIFGIKFVLIGLFFRLVMFIGVWVVKKSFFE